MHEFKETIKFLSNSFFFSSKKADEENRHIQTVSPDSHPSSVHHSRYSSHSPQDTTTTTTANHPNHPHHPITHQPYGSECSGFGPVSVYHHHTPLTHGGYSNPYEKYKLATPGLPRNGPTVYPDSYQFYGTSHHHQLLRPNGYIDLLGNN